MSEPWLIIPTRNRASLLRRAVNSVIVNADTYSRRLRLLICDQSRESEAKTNIAMLSGLAAAHPQHGFHYLGSAERIRALGVLDTMGIARPDLARFALDPAPRSSDAFGANRNWALILTAGHHVISIDDDVICTPVRLATPPPDGISAPMGAPPWSLLGFDSRQHLAAAVTDVPIDALSAYCRDLGRRVPSPFGNPGDEGRVAEELKIVLTSSGVAGHSGLNSHAMMPALPCPVSRRAMFSSDRRFGATMRSGHTLRQCLAEQISTQAGFLATAYGMDNTEPLIPFFPFGRGEDQVFAKTLSSCGVNAAIKHLPFALWHEPTHGRLPADDVAVISSSMVMCALIDNVMSRAGDDIRHSAQALGCALEQLTLGTHADWEAQITDAIASFARKQLLFCASAAGADDLPSFAFATLDRQALLWERMMQSFATDDRDALKVQIRCLGDVKTMVCAYGELLQAWAALWESGRTARLWATAARELRPSGGSIPAR